MNIAHAILPLLLCAALPSQAEKVLFQPGELSQTTNEPPAQSRITGTFALRADAEGSEGKNVGGACLLFQHINPTHACQTSRDCAPTSINNSGGSPNVPADWYGYCPPAASSTCWFRPGPRDAYCNLGLTLALDQTMSLPTAEVHPTRFNGRPVRWRVVTCQNLVAGGCGNPNAVEGTDKRLLYGPIWTSRP